MVSGEQFGLCVGLVGCGGRSNVSLVNTLLLLPTSAAKKLSMYNGENIVLKSCFPFLTQGTFLPVDDSCPEHGSDSK